MLWRKSWYFPGVALAAKVNTNTWEEVPSIGIPYQAALSSPTTRLIHYSHLGSPSQVILHQSRLIWLGVLTIPIAFVRDVVEYSEEVVSLLDNAPNYVSSLVHYPNFGICVRRRPHCTAWIFDIYLPNSNHAYSMKSLTHLQRALV